MYAVSNEYLVLEGQKWRDNEKNWVDMISKKVVEKSWQVMAKIRSMWATRYYNGERISIFYLHINVLYRERNSTYTLLISKTPCHLNGNLVILLL